MLDYALAYARIGWPVFPVQWVETETDADGVMTWRCSCGDSECKRVGKHPMTKNGLHDATTDEAQIRDWWTRWPLANIGVPTGEIGWALDIDVSGDKRGDLVLEQLERAHGLLPQTLKARTQSGGWHFVFAKALMKVVNTTGTIGAGIDSRGSGGYIIVEPSRIRGTYAFEDWDVMAGVAPELAPAPQWLLEFVRSDRPEGATAPVGRRFADTATLDDLRSALGHLDSDGYQQWIWVGQALRPLEDDGYWLWDEWSRTSAKYAAGVVRKKWYTFRPTSIGYESIFWRAQAAGWINPRARKVDAPSPITAVRLASVDLKLETPAHLLMPPGIAGDVARWVEGTARKSQPQFAASTGLAFCGTALGRRYVTNRRNWPSLFFLHIGKSASGKEHAKWALEHLLEACGIAHLIGPAGYTSEAGLLSALLRQPSHVAIVDEYGKVLESASVRQNPRAASAMKALMETWARADGVLRPQGYSTFGLSSRDADEMASRSIRNPALTLLAMTTPESFFDSIGSAAARDGFLNRFVIIESEIGRQVGQSPGDWAVPQSVIDWTAEQRPATLLVNPDINSSMAPQPRVITITEPAERLFAAFEADCIAQMDAYEVAGLGEMFGRTCEISMRVALIVARSCGSDVVRGQDAEWGIDFARHYACRAVEALRTRVADSEFQMACKQVLQVILRTGARGCTDRELTKASRRFDAARPRDRADMLTSLAQSGSIAQVTTDRPSGRGKRVAWVTISHDDEDPPC